MENIKEKSQEVIKISSKLLSTCLLLEGKIMEKQERHIDINKKD